MIPEHVKSIGIPVMRVYVRFMSSSTLLMYGGNSFGLESERCLHGVHPVVDGRGTGQVPPDGKTHRPFFFHVPG